MKKALISLIALFLLVACERPATITNWSPINDAGTPASVGVETPAAVESNPTEPTLSIKKTSTPTPMPTLEDAQLPTQLPESAKGYELVSWQSGKDWNFTLVSGTNREKTFEELMSPENQISEDGLIKITVTGIDQIKKVLKLLPAGTEVFWSGMNLSGQVPEGTLYFSYPPAAVMKDLTDFCAGFQVSLSSLAEPGQ